MPLDHRPLQHAAWSQIHSARKRLEKATRDLHRHEETDTPAYAQWMHSTFPQPMTALRELQRQVEAKAHDIAIVQYLASVTGRSLKKLWREHKEAQLAPDFEEEPPPSESESTSNHQSAGDEDDRESSGHSAHSEPVTTAPSIEAREIYRRLVQHLHPDRGGEWTPARERRWHEVQQAWNARDTDWLSRLEIDWEATSDTLSPDSPLSRLQQALIELHAARRDTERKLRDYRTSHAWRFTLSEKKRPQLHRRMETELREDLIALQRHLAYLNHTIATWESPRTASKKTAARRS